METKRFPFLICYLRKRYNKMRDVKDIEYFDNFKTNYRI